VQHLLLEMLDLKNIANGVYAFNRFDKKNSGMAKRIGVPLPLGDMQL